MPTYEYTCRSCGEHLEVVQSFKDDALTVCTICGGELKKVFGNIGIVFKGSGFYKTDSRSSSTASKPGLPGSSEGSASSADAPKTTTDAKTTTDTKPAETKAPAKESASSVSSSTPKAAAS